ncbi:hypothetical protein EGW08_013166 [Elysia chlorotica]|uniref:Uncharacterized protein n=1 Tax=Elysia chlorotica TaxID=188477 RepID=A0A3S1BAQ9_ELYCH|nr:hypothetical protein EGW08_013166 [Elysia chlorotica]
MLLQIAEILPRERQGVLACCNPIPPLVRQSLMEIHAMVLQAREVALIKVEKRPVVQPSNDHHPKYDVNSLLTCPHDMSHMDQSLDHLEQAMPEDALVSNTGSMFGKTAPEAASSITLKTTPSITAYEWKDHQIPTTSTAKRLAERVKGSFSNPFAKFMPSNLRESASIIQPQSSDMWVLKASNVVKVSSEASVSSAASTDAKKRKAERNPVDLDSFEPSYVPPSKRSKVLADPFSSTSPSGGSIFAVPKAPATPSLFKVPQGATGSQLEDSVERKIKSLREEVNIKKKKKRKALKEKHKKQKEIDNEESETPSAGASALGHKDSNNSSSLSSSSTSAISTTEKSDILVSAPPDVQIPNIRDKKKKGKKNKKLTIEDVEKNFSEFDYSAAGKAFEKKKKEKKKTDIYNPSLPSRTGKDKNKAKKPRLSGANSNKLVSFGPSTPGQKRGKDRKN